MSDKTVAQDTPAPKRRKGPILILVAALLILGGGGAAAWVLMKPGVDGHDAIEGAAVRAKKHTTLFVPLEQFTVNLADDGGERMAQIAVTLEVTDAQSEAALKARMPALRNGILLQLSASQSADLLTLAGKQRLATRIAELAGGHLGWTSAAAPSPAAVPAPLPARKSAAPAAAPSSTATATASLTPVPTAPRAGNETVDPTPANPAVADARPNPVEAVHFSSFIIQ